MSELEINADRTRTVIVHGAELPWSPSPRSGVERRMLERRGGEVADATSIVRYAAGARFDRHAHALGEEIYVLEGVFCDEHGRHPAGTYLRNPPGTSHAPFSEEGCVIFVKLRQMSADDRDSARICLTGDTRFARLHAGGKVEVVRERFDAGASLALSSPGGLELFLLEGSATLGAERLARWSWVRSLAPIPPLEIGPTGALIFIKRGHLLR